VFGQVAPPEEVSPMRYRIGLVMFCLPFLLGSVSRVAPQFVGNHIWVDFVLSAMLFASLFVLGGNFWDKVRALFYRDARVVFPEDARTERDICAGPRVPASSSNVAGLRTPDKISPSA
jgi:hypothetical protein